MFEESETVARSLVERIRAAARTQNMAAAAMLTSVGHLFAVRMRETGEHADWAVDATDAVAAEVSAALRISHGSASRHVELARKMREDLPKVAAVFRAGDIDLDMFQLLAYRTDLLKDDEAKVAVDTELAAKVSHWPSLSRSRIGARVDRIVARHDRDAVRRRHRDVEDRTVEIYNSGDGLSEIRGFLRWIDGLALEERLDAMAAAVCAADPRNRDQRRADALGALGGGADRLACECGADTCAGAEKVPTPVVIHVIADEQTVDGAGETPGLTATYNDLIPPDLLQEMARTAKLAPLVHPADAPVERGYTPSVALADYIRCRDLTCRFPGCDQPATDCDIDHTIPHGRNGPIHASNLKSLCRKHHLLKTFWGWHDEQLPDATVIWTSPAGDRYITTPGSAILFPTLATPTVRLAPTRTTADDRAAPATAMMPTRRRTRAQNRARRIDKERLLNRQDREVARSREWWEQTLRIATAEPPPF